MARTIRAHLGGTMSILLWVVAASAAPAQPSLADRVAPPGRVTRIDAVQVPFAGGSRAQARLHLDGHPVYGLHPRAWWSADGHLTRTEGRLPSALPAASARIGPEAALAVVAGRFVGVARSSGFTELAWRAEGAAVTLAWRVPIVTAAPASFDAWVDANSGAFLALTPTSISAEALWFPSNPIASDLERTSLPSSTLDGPYARPWSCVDDSCEAVARLARPNLTGDIAYFPAPGAPEDPFAEGMVFAHLDRMGRWLDDSFALRLPWAPIDAFVGLPIANAFFGDLNADGVPDVSFGVAPGVGVPFAYDADVVYHELGHAVVGALAPSLPFLDADVLGHSWVAGAVNEGVADAFAMLLTGDPLVGEYAGSAFARPAIRDVSRQRRCPDDLVGQVHHDGQIVGSLVWRWIEDPEIGPDLAGELVVATIPSWGLGLDWPLVGASFAETAAVLRDAGTMSEAAYVRVMAAIDDSGLVGCERLVPLPVNAERAVFAFNAGLLGPYAALPPGVQLVLAPSDEATELVLRGFDADPRVEWALHARAGEPVGHEVTALDAFGLRLALPTHFDERVEGREDGLAWIVPASAEPIYLTVSSLNVGIEPLDFTYTSVMVERRALAAPPAPPRAVAASAEAPAGCASRPGDAHGALVGLSLGLLRRRVRSRGASRGGRV